MTGRAGPDDNVQPLPPVGPDGQPVCPACHRYDHVQAGASGLGTPHLCGACVLTFEGSAREWAAMADHRAQHLARVTGAPAAPLVPLQAVNPRRARCCTCGGDHTAPHREEGEMPVRGPYPATTGGAAP